MISATVTPACNALWMRRRVPGAARDVGAYRRCFGVVPQFLAEQHAVVFPARLLAQPVRTADPELRRILQNSVSEYWAVLQPDVAEMVLRGLQATVISADATLDGVEKDLSMHPRTLNRRLQVEGAGFRDLLNQARFHDVGETRGTTRRKNSAAAWPRRRAPPPGDPRSNSTASPG